MTRRLFAIGACSIPVAAAVRWDDEMESGDVAVRLFDADEQRKAFGVGVRAPGSPGTTSALVEVFYDVEVAGIGKVLLHQESMAPIAGRDAYGATNQNFTMPRESVRHIRVTLFERRGPAREFHA